MTIFYCNKIMIKKLGPVNSDPIPLKLMEIGIIRNNDHHNLWKSLQVLVSYTSWTETVENQQPGKDNK